MPFLDPALYIYSVLFQAVTFVRSANEMFQLLYQIILARREARAREGGSSGSRSQQSSASREQSSTTGASSDSMWIAEFWGGGAITIQ